MIYQRSSGVRAFDAALREAARPFDINAEVGEILDLVGQARIVMLGEATHGTSEFYTWRRIISERLIRDLGFSFFAVEGDWPDCQRVHRYITGSGNEGEDPVEALAGYRRFPTWMWGNEEVLELVRWLSTFNVQRSTPSVHQVGFHGLDVYSLHDSMRLVVEYLRRVDPAAAEQARRAYGCFEPYGADPQEYAYAARLVDATCEDQVVAALAHMERLERIYSRVPQSPDSIDASEAYFDATMNARVTRNAEAYYRAMIGGAAESWNIRDRHMMETLGLLLDRYGPESRAIVWAHNTHIGDYRATDMAHAGYVNIGGLARQQFGADEVRLIGFATHHGTVMAARAWGDRPQVMEVPDAMAGSLEDRLHKLERPHALIALRDLPDHWRSDLKTTVGHRAIGVVYHAESERPGNYVPTRLSDRYDALIFIDRTEAVRSLKIPADLREELEAWPSGL